MNYTRIKWTARVKDKIYLMTSGELELKMVSAVHHWKLMLFLAYKPTDPGTDPVIVIEVISSQSQVLLLRCLHQVTRLTNVKLN